MAVVKVGLVSTIKTLQKVGGTKKPYNRFGQRFDRYKSTQAIKELTTARRDVGLSEMEQRTNVKKIITWDTAPDKSYFQELFRVSRNQIIWGGKLL